MTNSAFKRQIPIASLFREVTEWNRNNKDKGIVRLTEELCDAFSHVDPGWMGEEGWTDALDQYVYVEYLVKKNSSSQAVVVVFSSMEEMRKNEGETINMIVRSCEDDICMEILASDVMVRYCVAENPAGELWDMVVRETAVLLRLYEMNRKGTETFWTELFQLNKHLEVISEQPLVKVLLGNEVLKTFGYDPATPVPQGQCDTMQIFHEGKMTGFAVSKRTFCYEHPLMKLTEIHIRLESLQ